MNSGRRVRRSRAAVERTVKRSEGSVLDHGPLWKIWTESATMVVTVSWGVESIVAMGVSVAGLRTVITWVVAVV